MHTNEKASPFYDFFKGIFKENPLLCLVLGMCPALAVTSSLKSAVYMGITTAAVLLCSNVITSLLRKITPSTSRWLCSIIIVASLTAAVQMLAKAYFPAVDETLDIYLPLIAVNCMILGRSESFASSHGVVRSALDGAGMGIGFALVLALAGAIREFLGAASVWGYEAAFMSNYKISFFIEPSGGFLIFAVLLAAAGLSASHTRKVADTISGEEDKAHE